MTRHQVRGGRCRRPSTPHTFGTAEVTTPDILNFVMTKLLVLHYSMYGHVEMMAQAVAEGSRAVDGVEVTIKRGPR